MKKNLRNVLVLSLGLITTIKSLLSGQLVLILGLTILILTTEISFTKIYSNIRYVRVHISGDHYWNTDGTTSQGLYEFMYLRM